MTCVHYEMACSIEGHGSTWIFLSLKIAGPTPSTPDRQSSNRLIADYLHAACEAFIQTKALEKLRWALGKQTKITSSLSYKTGGHVFY